MPIVIPSKIPGLPPFIMPAYRRSEEWQALRDRTDETRVLLDNARRYRESDVPERFVVEGWSLANMREPPKCTRTLAGKHFDGSAIKAFLNNILEGKPRTAVFCGQDSSGDGKTTCACAIIRELCLVYGKHCGFYTWAELCKRLAACELKNTSESREHVLYSLTRNALVVLDDVARVRNGLIGEVDTLFDLVNLLYQKGVSLIITCNMSVDDFINRYGIATADRLRDNGTMVTFPAGESLRGRMAG